MGQNISGDNNYMSDWLIKRINTNSNLLAKNCFLKVKVLQGAYQLCQRETEIKTAKA